MNIYISYSTHKYTDTHTHRLYGISSHDYGGWQVQKLKGGLQAGDLGELMLRFKSKGSLLAESLRAQERSFFCSIQAIS